MTSRRHLSERVEEERVREWGLLQVSESVFVGVGNMGKGRGICRRVKLYANSYVFFFNICAENKALAVSKANSKQKAANAPKKNK